MLNRIAKTFFVATTIAPICISLAYALWYRGMFWPQGLLVLCFALLLSVSCFDFIKKAKLRLESFPIKIKKAKSADKDVMGFFVAYVSPLLFAKTINIEPTAILLFIALLAAVVWGTHYIQVNPILGMFGFHFYEVESDDGITFLLITKRRIVNVKDISEVVQLTEYLILDRK